jgi:putative inorganic carbon (hco3(-)) transporter
VDVRVVWAESVFGRLLAFVLLLWENSVLGRASSAVVRWVGDLFADSVLGRAWYTCWPDRGTMAESRFGRLLGRVGRSVDALGRWLSPFVVGLWETSQLGRLVRWTMRTFGPWMETSFLVQSFFGYPNDVELAPAELGRGRTSPLVYLLGIVLGLLPVLPPDFPLSPTILMIVGIWGVAALWFCDQLLDGGFRWRSSSVMLPLASLLVIAAAATVQSADVGASVLSFAIWLTAGLLFFLMINLVRNSRDAAALLGPVLVGGILLGLWALYQLKNPPVITENWVDPSEGNRFRAFASLENPNYLAEYMVLYLPLAIALWFQTPKRWLQLAVPILFMAAALYLSGSRGGWLVFAGALAVFFLLRFRKYSFLLVAAGIAGLLLAPTILPAKDWARIQSAFTLANTSNKYRVSIVLGVWNMVKEHWALGAGLGAEAFGKLYTYYALPAARAAHAHNTYLQILAEMGIFGLTAVVWTLWEVMRRTVNAAVNGRNAMLIAAVPSALVALLVHGAAEHIWYNPKLLFAFWAVAGLGVGLLLGDREDAAA